METPSITSRRGCLSGPIIIAGALALWQTQARYGGLDLAFGGFAWLYWIAVIAWGAWIAVAIRMYRTWWLLITAPLVLYPTVIAAGLLSACVRGDCL